MSFKFKPLNSKYLNFIKSFNDKKRFYDSFIWIRFMKRVKTFGYKLRNKLKWRVISYCQPLNGYRVDFSTYHTVDAVFRAKVERKKAEKERKAAAKKNKKKVVVSTPITPANKRERLERADYVSRPEILNFKLYNNFIKKNANLNNIAVEVEGSDDEELQPTTDQIYKKLINKSKKSSKKLVKKKRFYNSKYYHLVNQFFMSKQRTREGIEIPKTTVFNELDPRVKLLIRSKLNFFKTYYKKRSQKIVKNTRLYLAQKKAIKGFDLSKFRHVNNMGKIIDTKKNLKFKQKLL